MDTQTVKQHIDRAIFPNRRKLISADILNSVLTDMLTLQDQNDKGHDSAIGDMSEDLTYLELDELLNL